MKSVRAVERAIDVLTAFSAATPRMRVATIQQHVKLNRPTLYRLLYTLERKGFLKSDGDPQHYQLDSRVMHLASTWMAGVDITRVGSAYLSALSHETNETVGVFTPLTNKTRVCVQELRSREPLALALGIGQASPIHLGASGKAILAFLEPEDIERVVLDVAAHLRRPLLLALRQVRRQGFAIARDELILGAFGIAAPLFNHVGAVTGSIALYGPHARIGESVRERYIRLVRDAGRGISRALGHGKMARDTRSTTIGQPPRRSELAGAPSSRKER